MFHCEVVVESIFDGRTEGKLDVGIESHYGTSHKMSGGVAQSVEVSIVLHGVNYSGSWRKVKRFEISRTPLALPHAAWYNLSCWRHAVSPFTFGLIASFCLQTSMYYPDNRFGSLENLSESMRFP